MIIIIQLLLIIIAVLILKVALGTRNTYAGHAWKKIGMIALASLMIVAVLFPNTTNDLAHMLGIGRGADLLLYATVVAFILYALNNYLKTQEQRRAIIKLSRKIALLEAEKLQK